MENNPKKLNYVGKADSQIELKAFTLMVIENPVVGLSLDQCGLEDVTSEDALSYQKYEAFIKEVGRINVINVYKAFIYILKDEELAFVYTDVLCTYLQQFGKFGFTILAELATKAADVVTYMETPMENPATHIYINERVTNFARVLKMYLVKDNFHDTYEKGINAIMQGEERVILQLTNEIVIMNDFFETLVDELVSRAHTTEIEFRNAPISFIIDEYYGYEMNYSLSMGKEVNYNIYGDEGFNIARFLRSLTFATPENRASLFQFHEMNGMKIFVLAGVTMLSEYTDDNEDDGNNDDALMSINYESASKRRRGRPRNP